MADQTTTDRDFGRYFALAQIGLEMVAPIVLGVYLDKYFGWTPWATAVGAVLGLVGGLAHLVVAARRQEDRESADSSRDAT